MGGTRVCAVAVDDEAALSGPLRHRHAERVEEREIFLRGPAARGEVVADDQRVRTRDHAHRLQLAEHELTTAGEPQPRAREDEAEERDRLERLARSGASPQDLKEWLL